MARPPHEDPEYQRNVVCSIRQGLLSMSSQQQQQQLQQLQQQPPQQHPHPLHYGQQIQQQLSAAIKPPLPGHQTAQLHLHHQQQQQQQQQQSLNNNNSNSSNNNAISQSGSNSNGSSGGVAGGSSGAVHPHSNTSPLMHHNYTWSQVSPTSPQKHVRLSPRPSYPYPSPNYSNQIAQQHHYQQQQQLGQIQLSPGGTNYHQQSTLGGIGGSTAGAGQVQPINGAGPFVTPGISPATTASSKSSPLSPNRRTRGENKKCRKVYGMDHKEQWCTQCKWKKACSRFGD